MLRQAQHERQGGFFARPYYYGPISISDACRGEVRGGSVRRNEEDNQPPWEPSLYVLKSADCLLGGTNEISGGVANMP